MESKSWVKKWMARRTNKWRNKLIGRMRRQKDKDEITDSLTGCMMDDGRWKQMGKHKGEEISWRRKEWTKNKKQMLATLVNVTLSPLLVCSDIRSWIKFSTRWGLAMVQFSFMTCEHKEQECFSFRRQSWLSWRIAHHSVTTAYFQNTIYISLKT